MTITKHIHKHLLFFSLFFPFLSCYAWGPCLPCSEYPGPGFWFVSLGVGRSHYMMDRDNYISPGPNWPNDHYFKNTIHDGSFLNARGGFTWLTDSCDLPAISLGLSFDYAFSGKVSGNINQYNLNQFQNYTYSYDFSRQTLLAIGKLDIYRYYGLMPYLIAGAGVSVNKASNYSEEPLEGVTPRISPGYGTRTKANLSYIVGLGLDYAFNDTFWMSLEYNYGDFGHVETSTGQGTPTVTGVNYSDQHLENEIRANSFLLSVTYLVSYI